MRYLTVVLISLSILCAAPSGAQPAEPPGRMVLPMVLDYPMIRALMIRQIFGRPGQALVLQGGHPCTRLKVWGPEIAAAPEGGLVRLALRMSVTTGVGQAGKCSDSLSWSGYLEMLQQVGIQPGAWRLTFRTTTTRLYDRQGRPAKAAEIVWRVVQRFITTRMDGFTIDLAEPVAGFSQRLPLLFRAEQRQKVARWLAQVRPGPVAVEPTSLRVNLLAPPPPQGARRPAKAGLKPLTKAQLAEFQAYWQTWDAFVVHQITALRGQHLTQAEQDDILAILLDQRHAFLRALASPHPSRDLVREQFLATWQGLGPILRRRLFALPEGNPLKLIAFFTAADALTILDRLGPGIGLDISQEGLHRLAELVAAGRAVTPLDYTNQVNPALRGLLGLPPQLQPHDLPQQVPIKRWTPPPGSWLDFIAPPAHAAPPPATYAADVTQWAPPTEHLQPYLRRVRGVLGQAAEDILKPPGIPRIHHDFFRRLAQATAWQESCWRQFKPGPNGQGLVYLRSYNRTSVGMMQVNELVWRGLYQTEKLRWSISYNAAAGCEILGLYLRRYVLRRAAAAGPLSDDDRAGLVYAMYNGGPSQFAKYLKRSKAKRLFLSDRLFSDKYSWVKSGDFSRAAECLIGKP